MKPLQEAKAASLKSFGRQELDQRLLPVQDPRPCSCLVLAKALVLKRGLGQSQESELRDKICENPEWKLEEDLGFSRAELQVLRKYLDRCAKLAGGRFSAAEALSVKTVRDIQRALLS